jgi:hypothetical protein
MTTDDQTFFWGGDAKFAVVQRNNGRIWMIDDRIPYLSSIPAVFQSKIPLMLLDISTVKNNRNSIIDNSCCYNWTIKFQDQQVPVPMKKLSSRWVDYDKVYVCSENSVLSEHVHDADPIEIDLRRQLFLYYNLVRDAYHYFDQPGSDLATIMTTMCEIFGSNLYIQDIYEALVYHRRDMFHDRVLKYIERDLKYA